MGSPQVIDYERFRSSANAVTLYEMFKADLLRRSSDGESTDFGDLMPKEKQDASMIKHYFYMSVLYSFEAYERQVYRLGNNLAHMFMRTKLPKLSLDDVKPPYSCFYMSLPQEMNLEVDSFGQHLRAHGCYVFDSRDPENPMGIKLIKKDGDVLLNEINFVIAFHGRDSPGLDNDLIQIFSLSPGEKDLENYIKQLEDRDFPPDFVKVYQQIARVALNLVFYLNSSNREIGAVIRPDQKRVAELEKALRNTREGRTRIVNKLTQKLDKAKNQVIITKLAPSLEKRLSIGSPSSTPTGRTVRKHWVPGFYNYYWCNNKDEHGNKLSGKHVESRWIEPYERGTDVGKVVRKHYEVQDINLDKDAD